MILDFEIMHGGGVAIVDRDKGTPITRVCYVNDRDGLYARWWWAEDIHLPADLEYGFESSWKDHVDPELAGQIANPTRLVVYRCNIGLTIDKDARLRYEVYQPVIESRVWLDSRRSKDPGLAMAPSEIIVGNPISAALCLARPGTRAIVEALR